MKKLALLFLLALSTAVASAAAKPEKQTLTSDGAERIYYTFVPEKLAADKSAAPAPLLLLLHGSGRDGMSQINEWKDLAEKESFILAAPDSANSREWSMNTDGPEFLHQVVEAVRARNSVDGKRIYLFGHSAGAVFALYMGIMESKYFAAVGVHAGAMGEDFYPYLDLAKRKVPVMIWVGTEDPYFSLALVKATQSELNKHGFDAQVVEMKKHDHNYYAVAKELNPKIWEFFHGHTLDAGPFWQVYQRK
ncbi:MAG TPA: PHB depolymerase family esterase [Candidatus Angelobacter sp.]|nr:PHB depolymerase family esterase [Candidatus Angelobacter sp.]